MIVVMSELIGIIGNWPYSTIETFDFCVTFKAFRQKRHKQSKLWIIIETFFNDTYCTEQWGIFFLYESKVLKLLNEAQNMNKSVDLWTLWFGICLFIGNKSLAVLSILLCRKSNSAYDCQPNDNRILTLLETDCVFACLSTGQLELVELVKDSQKSEVVTNSQSQLLFSHKYCIKLLNAFRLSPFIMQTPIVRVS